MIDPIVFGVAFLAALAAGFINTLAGGGTLVSFPTLVALGIPQVNANITNTIALCPGYFGGIWAQRKDFAIHARRLFSILPVSIIGGIIGGLLLVHSDEQSFKILVPYLILIASLLLAVQVPLKKWLMKRNVNKNQKAITVLVFLPLFLASVYGGYFGAGVSVILLALLGLMYDDPLTSLNVLKQALSFSINLTAAIYFLFSGKVEWALVLVMCVGSITGGMSGGRFAGRISPDVLRWTVVSIGMIVAMVYFYLAYSVSP